MSILKRLTQTKNTTTNKKQLTESDNTNSIETTIKQAGFEASMIANGHQIDLEVNLNRVFQDFKQQCRNDKDEQHRIKGPYLEEKNKQETELEKRKHALENKERSKEEIEKDIHKINGDITRVRTQPHEYGLKINSRPRVQFYLGLGLLIPITLYLFVFYISASYAAFFRQVESSDLLAAILDPAALSKAWGSEGGVLEGLFICTLPFVFLGLGYLIHMFQKEKKKGILKISLLILVTFIFDCIIAYLIEKQIYDYNRTLLSEDFNVRIALGEPGFWGIIFAGFVVYIIWGLVLDFVLKEHENLDVIQSYVRELIQRRILLEKQRRETQTLIQNISEEITLIEGKINELNSKINGFIFPNRKYLTYHTQYLEGWFNAISEHMAMPNDRKEALKIKCKEVANKHLENNNVKSDDAENILYTKIV